jgi:hypothetical protein
VGDALCWNVIPQRWVTSTKFGEGDEGGLDNASRRPNGAVLASSPHAIIKAHAQHLTPVQFEAIFSYGCLR